ncbi:hypothetical protein C8J57DRAFT_1480837 [Mycena rebaudengoi]|nr:hypothetical protein C8J57DRAFT_1480837 [Mycena rebaudengoi]
MRAVPAVPESREITVSAVDAVRVQLSASAVLLAAARGSPADALMGARRPSLARAQVQGRRVELTLRETLFVALPLAAHGSRESTNIYCTVLIAWRVWTQTRAKKLMFVVSVLIESAALYTAWTLFTITSSMLNSNIQAFAVGLIAQVIGLANMLIYLRVGLEPRTSTPTQEETGIVMTTFILESDECHSGFPVPD